MAIGNDDLLEKRISHNLSVIKGKIAKAAERAGRDPGGITLLAVTKMVEIDSIRAAIRGGIKAVGENRVQEAREKQEMVGLPADWHFIGHLQKNKVKYVLGNFCLIHSVDSYELAAEINRLASVRKLVPQDILLQVNIGEEDSKHGMRHSEVIAATERISLLPFTRIRGLMAIPPAPPDDNAEYSRPFFKRVAELKGEITKRGFEGVSMDILSFGMSGDFEVAIEEGSTIVRIGTAIFGERNA